LRLQNGAKGAKADVGIGEVMEHTGANNLIERASEFPNALHRQLTEFEVLELILTL
jgi:hypothetical protein